MNDYSGVINGKIFERYEQALVIDVQDDKIYKYVNTNGNFNCEKISSYIEYFDSCRKFVFEDDVDGYIDSLSIAKLEANGGKRTFNYKMLSERLGTYITYTNEISLYEESNKKIIIVLVAVANDKPEENTIQTKKSDLEGKLNKMADAVSLAMLKIHNIINMDNNLRPKDEYINSILVGLTTDYPELSKSFTDNAAEIYNSGRTTIMIVDDDSMTCNLIGKIFSKNYDVIVANNGSDAIEKLQAAKENEINISCIFLDLIMPVLDGFSVLNYLNDNNYLNKIPVIIISGNYDKETRNKAYSYQIADMLEKPFNAQVIRHRIENLINLYRSSGNINEMMLKQHENLKDIINSLVMAYEMDNGLMMATLEKYVKLLAMQVSVNYPEYNLSSNMIDKIAKSAGYYAIGNYTLSKSILAKKGEYSESEKESIKNANLNGAAIIKYVISIDNHEIDENYAYEIAKHYNERYDGNGYPEKLSGDSIPLAAQIASLAIEYMNLVNTITPVDYNRIASLIIMEAGHKFNPKIVEAFKKVAPDFEAITKVGG